MHEQDLRAEDAQPGPLEGFDAALLAGAVKRAPREAPGLVTGVWNPNISEKKLSDVRSRRYQCQFFRSKFCWKALNEIDQIDILSKLRASPFILFLCFQHLHVDNIYYASILAKENRKLCSVRCEIQQVQHNYRGISVDFSRLYCSKT